MFHNKVVAMLLGFETVVSLLIGWVQNVEAAPYKVLVVMSYEEDFPWDMDIKKGIDGVLGDKAELTYFYMNTKKDAAGGPQKAEEAYALYQTLQPDGVITSDDNAQSMFVVPYLKEKVNTPVMFAGVNSEPEKYGYPATNVSGILERHLLKESFAFAQQLVPSMKTITFLARSGATGDAMVQTVQAGAATYSVTFVDFKLADTLKDALAAIETAKTTSDALFVEVVEGLPDEKGNALQEKELLPMFVQAFGKSVVTNGADRVKYGALCAVAIAGEEHGRTAAEMLLQAMQGKSVADLPVTKNKFGLRMINADTMQALGIKPTAVVLRGAELVSTPK